MIKLNNQGVPITAQDALELWDSGEAVPAIQVEAEAHSQEEIYKIAFLLLRNAAAWAQTPDDAINQCAIENSGLTEREFHAAHSVAIVAHKKGWAAMIAQHDHPSIAKFVVKRPAPPEPSKGVAA
jgi:hypothetical protein